MRLAEAPNMVAHEKSLSLTASLRKPMFEKIRQHR